MTYPMLLTDSDMNKTCKKLSVFSRQSSVNRGQLKKMEMEIFGMKVVSMLIEKSFINSL